jgi:hypothetical protein
VLRAARTKMLMKLLLFARSRSSPTSVVSTTCARSRPGARVTLKVVSTGAVEPGATSGTSSVATGCAPEAGSSR